VSATVSDLLAARIAAMAEAPPRAEVVAFAQMLADEAGASAVLFYGSNLRTGSLEGVLDFYLLLPGPQRERIWPRVSYREWAHGGTTLRAKIATLSLEQFARAAAGRSRDTTIWARFVQASALVWSVDELARQQTLAASAEAAQTAARLAAALGPPHGSAQEFWRALFRATYRAEFRIEQSGREDAILAANESHFEGLLPLAWEAQGLAFERDGELLRPQLPESERRRLLRWWRLRRRAGRPLNILRLARATTTFEGAAAYGAWKLERHTGLKLEVTPFRAKHPLLAMPGAAWELWRARRRQRG